MWNEILYRPIYNTLILIYDILPYKDAGLAIILLTILIRLILFPLSWTSVRSQRLMQALAPELEKIKVKYKDDQKQLTAETMAFYQKHGINPLSSCLPVLIQLPILIALYQVLSHGINHTQYELLYSFVPKPETFNNTFLGLIDLTQPFYPLAIIAGAAQFLQSYLLKTPTPPKKKEPEKEKDSMFKAEDLSSAMNMQFMYIMPIMTTFIAWKLFAGLPLYWITTTLFSIGQQLLTIKLYPVKNITQADQAFHHHETKEFVLEPEILETHREKNVEIAVKKRIN